MIQFDTISYSNIMSVGNTPVTIDLKTHKKTLITGQNGAGKSTMIEAICFALYGKPFRNVTKPQLVNAVNKKKLLVEVTFRDKKHNYRVVRGIKPNKFEIYKDDELIPQDAAVADYQNMLENNILKMSLSTFKQIAVLGTAGFTPFMLLTAQKRREIVEDLLDIGIFSDMAAINKVALKDLTTKIRDTEADVEKRMSELRLHIEFQKEQETNREGNLAQLEQRKNDIESEIALSNERISELKLIIAEDEAKLSDLRNALSEAVNAIKSDFKEKLNELSSERTKRSDDANNAHKDAISVIDKNHDEIVDKIREKHKQNIFEFDEACRLEIERFDQETEDNTPPDNSEEITELMANWSAVKHEISTIEENLKFYTEHSDCPCPTCTQPISGDFLESVLSMANEKLDTLKASREQIKEELVSAKNKRDSAVEYSNERKRMKAELLDKNSTQRRSLFDAETTEINAEKTKRSDEIHELNNKLHDELIKIDAEFSDKKKLVDEEEQSLINETNSRDSATRDELSTDISTNKQELSALESSVRGLTSNIKTIISDIDDINEKSKTEDRRPLIKDLNSQLKKVKTTLDNDRQTKHCRDIVATLLKDDGVKSMIVKQYIPLINKYINEYLKTMNANYNFILDEEFNETIKSRGRDTFSYTSFSQGERCRIDLALLFAFRDLVSARTNSMTNLLVFDEILDGPSDGEAIDAFNMILNSVKSNVFVISHSDKHDQSSYDNHIKFKRKGNFTKEA